MKDFGFRIHSVDKKTKARTGVIHTAHGDIQTPAFVPVGTQGSVKSLSPDDLNRLGVEMYFVNTYHIYLRPGIDVIKKFGGLHKFMNWNKPLITDSGGFQVFSLARDTVRPPFKGGTLQGGIKLHQSEPERVPQLVKITEDGVEFRSHWDGSKHLFTPESSMQWQWDMGADIHIAFDDCTQYPVTHEQAKASMQRTHRWAVRSKAANDKCQMLNAKLTKPYQALYGSIQGSVFKDLRQESAKYISSLDFDGIAMGGVSVGESKKEMVEVLDWVCPILPDDKPRHLLGVGEIPDIFALVEHGIDTFDCVQPTRLGRVGIVFVYLTNKKHQMDITKAMFADDTSPVDPSCACYTCAHFSRAYLHHLFRVRELLAYRLATIHNIHFVNTLVTDIRRSIENGTFLELKANWVYTDETEKEA